jgi:hypothetical protein
VNRLARPPTPPKTKAGAIAPLGSVAPTAPTAHD